MEDCQKKAPTYPFKGLFLVQQENRHGRISFRSKNSNIAQESNIFPDEMTRDTARLVRGDDGMDNF